MRRVLTALAFLSLASFAFGQRIDDLNGKHTQLFPTKDQAPGWARPGGGGAQNLSYHGGRIIPVAKVVAIFWGSEWTGASAPTATEITIFLGGSRSFSGFGLTPEYNVITQYSDGSGNHVYQTPLLVDTFYDSTNPPPNATDLAVQGEVNKYLSNHNADSSTIYEVFLPSTSYASFSTYTSCGGPNLYFCAYHSNFISSTGQDILYASMPYPSCGGCQWSTWTAAQNLEHFTCHETREAVTDPDGNAWFDRRGNEADDKCAWSPAPFIGTGGYAYQYEWSNAVSGCVQKQ
jgi:hypothetical protein